LRSMAPPDYFVFGTVFASQTKSPGAPVHGIPGLAAAVSATDIPLIAIGGMTPGRAAECVAVGAAGVAAIGAFLPPGRSAGAMGVAAAAGAFHAAMALARDERRA
jgi:thiamine-phosphate pyrophosphorylase